MRTDRNIDGTGPIALIGFGEAGTALAEGWRDAGIKAPVRAYDIKTAASDDTVARAMWDRYAANGVKGASTLQEALNGASAVFSLVTADAAHDAARSAAQVIPDGALFFDCNSCAPETKRASAQVIEAAGARYVDVAIMSPIQPKRHEAPLLVSGDHAPAADALMRTLAMAPRIVEGPVGRASSVKMIRSIMVKGIEALTLECILSAREAGVDDEVIASLDASMPGWEWGPRAAYNIERTTTHGLRRAAEMREVVKTVRDLGLPPRMAAATVEWQQNMGDLALSPGPERYQDRADAIRDARTYVRTEEPS